MTDLSTVMQGASARPGLGNRVMMPDLPKAVSGPWGRYYELNTLEGPARIFRRTVAKGVTLDQSGISWVLTNGQEHRRAYQEIRDVHLDIQDRLELGTCRITFASGPGLRVFSIPDGKRYGQFIADLHHRLHGEGLDTIQFHGGSSPRWRVVGLVLMVVSIVFAVLGVGVSLWTDQASLKATVVGPLFMLFAAVAIWRRRPVTYTADQVPQRFFPKSFFSL